MRSWLLPYTALVVACMPVAFFLISMAHPGVLAAFAAWRGFGGLLDVAVWLMAPTALALVVAAFARGGKARWRVATWIALGLALGETLPIWWIAVVVVYVVLLSILAIFIWGFGLI